MTIPRQNLTANACTVCRRKRTKCDGQLPCQRCESRGENCTYEDKIWRTKDYLRSEIEKLRKEKQRTQALLRNLTVGDDTNGWKLLLARLYKGETPEATSRWLHASGRLKLVEPEGDDGEAKTKDASPVPHVKIEATTSKRRRLGGVVSPPSSPDNAPSPAFGINSPFSSDDGLAPPHHVYSHPPAHTVPSHTPYLSKLASPATPAQSRRPSIQVPPSVTFDAHAAWPTSHIFQCPWTSVPLDSSTAHGTLSHLFADPILPFPFMCGGQFMQSFLEGNHRYCSPALVNALLAYASQQTQQADLFAPASPPGPAFAVEAKRLLSQETELISVPDIQAFGVLAIVDSSMGFDDSAWYHAHNCVKHSIRRHLATKDTRQDMDREVLASVFCGSSTLSRLFRLLTGRLSPMKAFFFMRITDEEGSPVDSPKARLERGIAMQQHFTSQLKHCSPANKFVYQITEAVHSFLSYHHDGATTNTELVAVYDSCLALWAAFRATLPDQANMTPGMIFSQILYHFLLLTLCRPFINHPMVFNDGQSPRHICSASAEAVLVLADGYGSSFSFSHAPPILSHMIFRATIVQINQAPGLCLSSIAPPGQGQQLSEETVHLPYQTSSLRSAPFANDLPQPSSRRAMSLPGPPPGLLPKTAATTSATPALTPGTTAANTSVPSSPSDPGQLYTARYSGTGMIAYGASQLANLDDRSTPYVPDGGLSMERPVDSAKSPAKFQFPTPAAPSVASGDGEGSSSPIELGADWGAGDASSGFGSVGENIYPEFDIPMGP